MSDVMVYFDTLANNFPDHEDRNRSASTKNRPGGKNKGEWGEMLSESYLFYSRCVPCVENSRDSEHIKSVLIKCGNKYTKYSLEENQVVAVFLSDRVGTETFFMGRYVYTEKDHKSFFLDVCNSSKGKSKGAFHLSGSHKIFDILKRSSASSSEKADVGLVFRDCSKVFWMSTKSMGKGVASSALINASPRSTKLIYLAEGTTDAYKEAKRMAYENALKKGCPERAKEDYRYLLPMCNNVQFLRCVEKNFKKNLGTDNLSVLSTGLRLWMMKALDSRYLADYIYKIGSELKIEHGIVRSCMRDILTTFCFFRNPSDDPNKVRGKSDRCGGFMIYDYGTDCTYVKRSADSQDCGEYLMKGAFFESPSLNRHGHGTVVKELYNSNGIFKVEYAAVINIRFKPYIKV